MTLKQCTKEDLLWIIDRMTSFGQEFYLKEALRSLQYKKDRERIAEAEKISKLAHDKRQEYIDLLRPYDGKPWSDIPIDVLEKAEMAMKKAQSLDARWNQLMKIT